MKMRSFKSPLLAIGALFFIFGFITWICSVLIPYLQLACELNNFQAQLVSFAFYISYFVMAIPSGRILKRTGFKNGISLGLLIMMMGSLCFIPGAVYRQYSYFLTGLFIQGTGLAILQTAANPYVTILGPENSAAQRMSVMGICSGIAGVLAPIILGKIVLENADSIRRKLTELSVTEKQLVLDALAARVIQPYLWISFVLAALSLIFYRLKLPEPQHRLQSGDAEVVADTEKSIFAYPRLILGTCCLFLYVGVEVIAGNTIIGYATWMNVPLEKGKFFTALTMSGMLVGYLIGIICIPRHFSQHFALKISAVLGMAFTLLSLLTNGFISVTFIALLGLANALIWPSIWPIAISGLGSKTETASSLLVMAIAGGAIMPLLFGWLSDIFSPKFSYWLVIPCYVSIFWYSGYGNKK